MWGPETVPLAHAEEQSLLQTWSLRGSPFHVPTTDAAVFTTGVLPPTQAGRRHLIRGVEGALDALGLELDEAVALLHGQIRPVLRGRRLAVNELGAELSGRIAPTLPTDRRRVWETEGPYAGGQPLGEAVVHFCLRILTLQGVVCLAPREGNKAPFVLVDEWLGTPLPEVAAETARAELLRRYLHSYGPSTKAEFAAWVGVNISDADAWWELLDGDLAEVDYGGRAWVLAQDLELLRSAELPTGVRLLAPRDPYTQLRDRATIVDRKYHRQIWRTVGEPGTVLVDGEIAGIWRPRKKGRKLELTVSAWRALDDGQRSAIGAEAGQVATLRGEERLDLHFGG